LDDRCGDSTGRQALNLLQPSYATTFQGATTGAPTVALAIDVDASQAATVLCHPLFCPCDPPGPCQTTGCGNAPVVEIAASVKFDTSDGMFNELLPATLLYSAQAPTTVHWQASIPATDLHGSYTVMIGTPAQDTIGFGGDFDGTTAKGGISVTSSLASSGAGMWGY
jgi:hypothetical protein